MTETGLTVSLPQGGGATSGPHIRLTYRNFFPAEACWQFTGLRLTR